MYFRKDVLLSQKSIKNVPFNLRQIPLSHLLLAMEFFSAGPNFLANGTVAPFFFTFWTHSPIFHLISPSRHFPSFFFAPWPNPSPPSIPSSTNPTDRSHSSHSSLPFHASSSFPPHSCASSILLCSLSFVCFPSQKKVPSREAHQHL